MTDYRSLERLDVIRGGRRVGVLARLPRGCEFRYVEEFVRSPELPIAYRLPKRPEPFRTEGILNLPTFFAGLVPEGVMFRAVQLLIGSATDDLFSVLAATGTDTVGDVDIQVPGDASRTPTDLNLKQAREAIGALMNRTWPDGEAIGGLPGVQPKLSIGAMMRASRGKQFIAKFPVAEFPGLAQNELACMTLARRCGLRAPRARVEEGIYIVERFDRSLDDPLNVKRIHVEDMLQAMDLFPNRKYGMDFAEIADAMVAMGVSPAGILETVRLYVFSYLVGNGDLHAKNVSLVRSPDGRWRPSPAYDVVSTLPYKHLAGSDAMVLALADEAYGRVEMADFIAFGARYEIPETAIRKSIASLARSVKRLAAERLDRVLSAEDLATVLARAESLAT